jgi:hypothetical protein
MNECIGAAENALTVLEKKRKWRTVNSVRANAGPAGAGRAVDAPVARLAIVAELASEAGSALPAAGAREPERANVVAVREYLTEEPGQKLKMVWWQGVDQCRKHNRTSSTSVSLTVAISDPKEMSFVKLCFRRNIFQNICCRARFLL